MRAPPTKDRLYWRQQDLEGVIDPRPKKKKKKRYKEKRRRRRKKEEEEE